MRKGVLGLSLVLSLSLTPAYSATPPKAGSTCSKQGITKTYKGKVFKCKKVKGKLVWNKGKMVKQAAPVHSSTTTQIQVPLQNSISDPVSLCKIRDRSNFDPGVNNAYSFGGFVEMNPPVPATGEVTWYLVPIDFQDLKGEEDWRKRVDLQMKNVTTFYDRVSYGKLRIKWKVHEDWITLPDTVAKYRIEHSGDYDTTENFWKSAISEADKYIDFTNIQTINFVLPKNQKSVLESAQGFPWTGDIRNYFSEESKFASFTILGNYFESPGRSYWSYWAHEYGHVLGIPHLGGSRWSYSFQPYDLMGNQDVGREISGWSRFAVTHWIEDEWVYCKLSQNVEVELIHISPINSKGNQIKLAIIPINETKTLVLESRRRNINSELSPNLQDITYIPSTYPLYAANPIRDGVFVYIYDSSLGHNEEYLHLTNSNSNPILAAGDSIEYLGIKISVLEVGNVDKVVISQKK